jgi:hypothetical protein
VFVVLLVLLTGFELAAAVLAKATLAGGGSAYVLLGAGVWLVLYAVYVASLDGETVRLVTAGWIFTSMIGAVLVDRVVYGHPITPRIVVATVLVLGGVLLLTPTSAPAKSDPVAPDQVQAQDVR